MANNNVPTSLRVNSNDGVSAFISWEISIPTGYEVEVHASESSGGTYTLYKTVSAKTDRTQVTGTSDQYVKVRSKRISNGELSLFTSPPAYLSRTADDTMNLPEELQSVGSSIHLNTSVASINFDDGGDWVDILEWTDIPRFRKISSMTITVNNSPANPVYRLVEQTKEMQVYKEKMVPQAITLPASGSILKFTPIVQIQKNSNFKLQIKCNSGGANSGNFTLDNLDYIDYTVAGF